MRESAKRACIDCDSEWSKKWAVEKNLLEDKGRRLEIFGWNLPIKRASARNATAADQVTIRSLKLEITRLKRDLSGGSFTVECGTCKKGAKLAEVFSCLAPTCTTATSFTLHPEFQGAYKVLRTKKLCSLCVCREHMQHEVVPRGRVCEAHNYPMRDLYSQRMELKKKFEALPPPFNSIFDKVSRCSCYMIITPALF